MGQKAHPIGLRVGFYRKWKSNWFLDKSIYGNFLHLNFEINKYFAGILRNSPRKAFLSHCIVAKYSLESLYIFVFFYRLAKEEQKFIKRTKDKDNKLRYKRRPLLPKQSMVARHRELCLLKVMATVFLRAGAITLPSVVAEPRLWTWFTAIAAERYNLEVGCDGRAIENNYNVPICAVKNSLARFTGVQVSVTFINLLAFIKFYLAQLKHGSMLKDIQFQLTNFYKYDVKFLRDAINVFFISVILKQPQTLADFIGYQLNHTPKKRRHGRLIAFYKILMGMAFSQSYDLIGMKIQFKGRPNGRKRSKNITIRLGPLPLQSYDKFIEYGQRDAITIYGIMGIKIWIYYGAASRKSLQRKLLNYLYYKN